MIPQDFDASRFPYPRPMKLADRVLHLVRRWQSSTSGSASPKCGERLALQLQRLLAPRLAAASDVDAELAAIVLDLKLLGHSLVLDENSE